MSLSREPQLEADPARRGPHNRPFRSFAGAALCSSLLFGCTPPVDQSVPSATAWKGSTGEQRTAYMHAIAESGTALGMTSNELVEWLGEPDSWGEVWTYYIDPGQSDRGGPALQVYFDRDRKVVLVGGSAFPAADPACEPDVRLPNAACHLDVLDWVARKWAEGSRADRLALARVIATPGALAKLPAVKIRSRFGNPDRESGIDMTYDGRTSDGDRTMLAPFLSFQLRDGEVMRVCVGDRRDS